jgi:hypothetical protein
MSVVQVKIIILLDLYQLLILFVGMLIYSEPKQFLLIIFYKDTFLIIKTLI